MNRFKDDDTQRLFAGQSVRHLLPDIHRRARIKLQRVVAATVLGDLRVPPSHRLQTLRGGRQGQYSVHIDDQWRVCLIWTERGVMEIEVTDFH